MNARLALLAIAAGLAASGAAAGDDTESLNPVRGLDKAGLSAFVELPLFDPARRLPPPPPPAPVAVDVPAPPPPQEPAPVLQLVGIIHGKRDMAIVHQGGSEKTVILRNGETLGNWTVVVHPLGVTLHNGERSASYAIFAKAGAAAPTAPRPPVAVGQMMRRAPDE